MIKLKTGKECFVWFETNTQKYLDRYLKQAAYWESIGKPIATARIHNVEFFVKQMIDAGIEVTSGFKTSNLFLDKDYHDLESWSNIARTARKVSILTGNRPVILENESAVKIIMRNGITKINYEKLLNAISSQKWPEIWFWHAPTGRKKPFSTISMDIARAIMNGIPNARLIEPSSSGLSNSARHKGAMKDLKLTLSIDRNPISIIYLDDDRPNFWKLKDSFSAIEYSKGNTVILYPGHEDVDKSGIVLNAIKRQFAHGNNY
jgi:hypothetical protein